MTLKELFAKIDEGFAHGVPNPTHFAAIAKNGSIVAGHYTVQGDNRRIETVTEHVLDGDFATPVHVMFVATNFVARFAVTDPDEGEREPGN